MSSKPGTQQHGASRDLITHTVHAWVEGADARDPYHAQPPARVNG